MKRIRAALPGDVELMLSVKSRLRFSNTTRHGFLLGSSRGEYLELITRAAVALLLDDSNLLGFAIAMPDDLVRSSDLWQKRHMVQWIDFSPADVECEKLGYFAQLAVLPEADLYVLALAVQVILQLKEHGHRHLFATTVAEPVRNTAALPFLALGKDRVIGRLTEFYEEVGTIVSNVHYMHMDDIEKSLATSLGRRVETTMNALRLE